MNGMSVEVRRAMANEYDPDGTDLWDMDLSDLDVFADLNLKLDVARERFGADNEEVQCVVIPQQDRNRIRVKIVTPTGNVTLDDDWDDFPSKKLLVQIMMLSRGS